MIQSITAENAELAFNNMMKFSFKNNV